MTSVAIVGLSVFTVLLLVYLWRLLGETDEVSSSDAPRARQYRAACRELEANRLEALRLAVTLDAEAQAAETAGLPAPSRARNEVWARARGGWVG